MASSAVAVAGELIEIEGGLARLFRVDGEGRRTLDRQVSVRALADALAGRGSGGAWTRGILAPGTRMIMARGPSLVMAVEQGPQVRRVAWRGGTLKDPDGPPRQAALATPYVVYLLRFFQDWFEEMRVYYRTAPVQAETDRLCVPNLWNVQGAESPLARCRACLRGRPGLDGLSPGGQAQVILAFFWAAAFNRDVEDNCFDRSCEVDARVASLEAWEAATAADPLFPLQVAWPPAGLTLRQAAEHLLHWGHAAPPVEGASDVADLMYRLPEAPP